MLWPRPRTLSVLCPPCVRHVSASCPPSVRLVSALCLPWVCDGRVSKPCPLWVRLHKAVTWRTYGVQGLEADTRRTHGGQMAGKVWRRGHSGLKGHKADTRRTQGGHTADTWWTKRGDAAVHTTRADTRRASFGGAANHTQNGHKADTRRTTGWQTKCGDAAKAESRRIQGGQWRTHRRTSSGDVARAYRGQPFLLRENPTVNCFGKNPTVNCLGKKLFASAPFAWKIVLGLCW